MIYLLLLFIVWWKTLFFLQASTCKHLDLIRNQLSYFSEHFFLHHTDYLSQNCIDITEKEELKP